MDNFIRLEPVSEQKRSPLVWVGGNPDDLWDCWGNEVGKFTDAVEVAALSWNHGRLQIETVSKNIQKNIDISKATERH